MGVPSVATAMTEFQAPMLLLIVAGAVPKAQARALRERASSSGVVSSVQPIESWVLAYRQKGGSGGA
jgi:hypothetical protein